MAVSIKPKRSAVAGNIPTTSNIEQYEIAINTADKKVYTRDGSNNIIQLSSGSLSGLDDVAVTSPTDNQSLVYDAVLGKWKNFSSTVSTSLAGIVDWPVSISSTEVSYLDGVTSAIQTQLSSKQGTLVSGINIKTVNGSNVLGSGDLTIAALSGVTLNDGYTEEVYIVSGTTPALSPSNGSIQTWTLTASSAPTSGTWGSGQSVTLMIDDGSAYAITWTSMSITWKTGAGTAPTLNTTGYTVIELWKVGGVLYGARVGNA